MCVVSVNAQDAGLPPVKTSVVTTQRIGDLIVQSTVTPTWYVPNGVAVAVPAGQPNTSVPPSRVVNPPPVSVPQAAPNAAATPGPEQSATQVTTVVVSQQLPSKDAVASRRSSNEWKQKIDALAGDLETNKLALVDAQAQLLVAAEEEKRAAEEQVAAAQRRLDATKKQAERVAAYASSLQSVPVQPAAQPAAASVKPADVVASAPVEPTPTFTLRLQDRTIPAALTRWSDEAGYKLLWEAKEDPAAFEETYRKQFPDAVDDVIRDLRLAGRDVRMCEYKNKVVRIIPRSASCKITPTPENAVQLGASE